MGSFMDRMREKLQAAGEGAKRLGEVANWKLELSDARARLRDAYRDLGQAVAQRWLDADEDDARRDDHAYEVLLMAVERAREAVTTLEQRLESAREADLPPEDDASEEPPEKTTDPL